MLDFDNQTSPTWVCVYDVCRRVTASVFNHTSSSATDLIDEYVRLEVVTRIVRPGQVPLWTLYGSGTLSMLQIRIRRHEDARHGRSVL